MATAVDRSDTTPRPGASPPQAGGDRFVGSGLLLLAALFVVIQALAGEIIPPLAVPAGIYAALGLLVLRWQRRWLLAVVAALLLVHLVSSMPFLVEALAHPETPAGFVPEAFVVIAVVVVVVGSLLRLWRPQLSRRPLVVAGGALAVVAVVLSLAASAGVVSDDRQDGDVPLVTVAAQFPAQVEVAAGGTLWVDNQDAIRHTLVVEGGGVHVELPGSTAVRVPVDLPAGNYRYICDVPGHEHMQGELIVR